MEIHTDPKNTDFVIKSGASRKVEEWDAAENGTIQFKDEEEAKKLEEDPFYKLEYAQNDQQRAKEIAPSLQNLIDFKEELKDDFKMSQLMRKKFRTEKKELEGLVKEAEKKGLSIPLLPSSEADKLEASTVQFKPKSKRGLTTADKELKKQQQIEMLKKRKLLPSSGITTGGKATDVLISTGSIF
jgi:coiled-coil domain-containing protein 130